MKPSAFVVCLLVASLVVEQSVSLQCYHCVHIAGDGGDQRIFKIALDRSVDFTRSVQYFRALASARMVRRTTLNDARCQMMAGDIPTKRCRSGETCMFFQKVGKVFMREDDYRLTARGCVPQDFDLCGPSGRGENFTCSAVDLSNNGRSSFRVLLEQLEE